METFKKIINWLGGSLTEEKTKNWKIVVMCVIAATTFWFFNALNKNDYTTVVNYPVKFTFDNPNDSLILVKDPPEKIAIDVSGRGWILFRKTFWYNYAPIDINLSSPVDTKFLTRGSLLPVIEPQLNDLKVNYIVDDTIFINIERRISKKLKISIDSNRISLESNHRITSPVTIKPDSILVAGPSSIIGDLSESIELEINEEEIDSEFDDKINTNVLNLPLVTYYPEKVSVNFKVTEYIKKEEKVAIEWMKIPETTTLTVNDSLINISYLVGSENERQVDETHFQVIADFSTMNPEDSTVVLKVITLSDLITDINFSPQTVKVNYEQ